MNEQERLNALTAPLLTWYDSSKRVLPWRGIQLLARAGKFPAAVVYENLRRTVQVPCAGVVAQTLPELEKPLLAHCRERVHVGQLCHKAGIVFQHRLHARLLQHDLRHPDAVACRTARRCAKNAPPAPSARRTKTA